MAAEASLAARFRLVLALQLGRKLLLDDDVRIDALGLNRAARRRVIACGGQSNRAIATKGNNGLYRSLTKRTRTDHGGAFVTLKGARHDLRCGGRAAVDENGDLLALRNVTWPGLAALRLLEIAPLGENNRALL